MLARKHVLASAFALAFGALLLVPSTGAAKGAKSVASCGADCLYGCCAASGFGCSCYCQNGQPHCGCEW